MPVGTYVVEERHFGQSFLYLRDLMQKNEILDDVKLVIHAHEKTMPDTF